MHNVLTGPVLDCCQFPKIWPDWPNVPVQFGSLIKALKVDTPHGLIQGPEHGSLPGDQTCQV